MKYKLIVIFFSTLIAGCTSQWSSLTTKSTSDLQDYSNKSASEFIYNRYITEHDTAGLGYLYQGMDAITSVIKKNSSQIVTFEDLKKDFNLYKAHYNMADYSKIVKPSIELNNLCKVHGGKLEVVDRFTVNIPKMNLDRYFSDEFTELSQKFSNAPNIASAINKTNPKIYLNPDWGIPVLADVQAIRNHVLYQQGKLKDFLRARNSSKSNKLLSGNMAIQGEDAFDSAIKQNAFGVFSCNRDSAPLWKASITPLWNEIKQKTLTNVLVIQIAANDKSLSPL